MMVINHGGVSGGKDSTAMMLWMVFESGYDRAGLRFSWCDTGNELDETAAYVAMLSERVHPIETLMPERDFYELARHKKRFPSARARFCTMDLKMEPTRRFIYSLLDAGHEVLLHTGVRAAESLDRAKLMKRDFDSWYALPIYRPLLHWSLDDVWAIHERYGIPRNPVYSWGLGRVGCAPCVLCRKEEVRILADRRPDRIDHIRAEEERSAELGRGTTFFAPDKVPLLQRSRKVTTKDGRLVQIATIDDVVRWSRTDRGGLQGRLDLDDEETATCAHTGGLCE